MGDVMRQEIQEELKQLSEAEYQSFHKKLLPGVEQIMGVRLPALRGLAKKIASKEPEAYLLEMQKVITSKDCYYEEKMLFGLVIGYGKMSDISYNRWLDIFVPAIDNWAVCDSCCTTYKWMRKNPELWWEYIKGWAATDTEYGIRFGVVCMLDHFVDAEHITEILALCNQLRHPGYYAKMAVAWLVSVCFVKFPEQTYQFLQEDELDDFTHNKSIQKTCESYRVSLEWKISIRKLRRHT